MEVKGAIKLSKEQVVALGFTITAIAVLGVIL